MVVDIFYAVINIESDISTPYQHNVEKLRKAVDKYFLT